MAKRKFKNKLVDIANICEPMVKVAGSRNTFVTPSGNIYEDYGEGRFFKKSTFVNCNNGYVYVNYIKEDGSPIQRRVHRMVAEAFLPNPDNLPVVMHIDNDKSNPNVTNLKWGTVRENTKSSFDDGLAKNDKGFDDSQSHPVVVFDENEQYMKTYGSICIASKELNIAKGTISSQCKHMTKGKPRKGYYFRYLDEYTERGFVL